MILLLLADVVYIILEAYLTDDNFDDPDGDTLMVLNQLSLRAEFISQLFERVADVLTVITLVEVGSGLMNATASLQKKRPVYQTVLFFLAIGVGVVLLALALADFGKTNQAWSDYWSVSPSFYFAGNRAARNALDVALIIASNIGSAFDVLSFVISIALVAYGAVVMHVYRAHPTKSVGANPPVLTRNPSSLHIETDRRHLPRRHDPLVRPLAVVPRLRRHVGDTAT